MSNSKGILGFLAGALFGAAAGMVAGILVAPRPGVETRTMAADVATDAWGNVVDAYRQSATEVTGKAAAACEDVSFTSDELREKVANARARMDQIRSALANAAGQVVETVGEVEIEDPVVEKVPSDESAPEA